MIARLLEHKANQTARQWIPPPSRSPFVRALIRVAYLGLTPDGLRQQRLV